MNLNINLSNFIKIPKKFKIAIINKLNFFFFWLIKFISFKPEKKVLLSEYINYYKISWKKHSNLINYKFNKLKYKLNNSRINMEVYNYFSYYTFKKIKIERYAKDIKKDRFNVLAPLKLKNNTFLNWYLYNQINMSNTKIWKFMLKKNYRNFFFKIKLWPKKKRTLKWKLQLKASYININIRKIYQIKNYTNYTYTVCNRCNTYLIINYIYFKYLFYWIICICTIP